MLRPFCRFRFGRVTVSHFLMKRKLDAVLSSSSEAQAQREASRCKMSTSTSIELTAREAQLRKLLLDVADHIDSSSDAPREKLELRWAGGWVRDKLLGTASHDIDTAINAMTGEAFALALRAYCDDPRHSAAHGIGPDDIGHLHRIARNPDKSKHLETATTRLFGLDVDFVNLRRETYAADSRNPAVAFGTPLEDARRRDATVNALFYNLRSGAVEDLVGGLEDLRAGLLRTPMPPLETFTDDPLRVLRLVRFATRLGFAVDPAAETCMGDARVLDALRMKISRERVGVELEKMLKGKDPCASLHMINRLGLYHAIFTDPTRGDNNANAFLKPDLAGWRAAYRCLAFLERSQTPGSLYDELVRNEEEAYLAWVLVALAPIQAMSDDASSLPGHNSGKSSGKQAALPLAAQAAREGFKAPTKVCDVVAAAQRNRAAITELKELVCAGGEGADRRDTLGMAIREWDARGGHWRVQVLSAALVDVMRGAAAQDNKTKGDLEEKEEELVRERALAGWQHFVDHLARLDLMYAHAIRRLVDGRDLASQLGVKPGKWMSPALDMVIAWQLRNPEETDPAGAIEEVRRRRGELGI